MKERFEYLLNVIDEVADPNWFAAALAGPAEAGDLAAVLANSAAIARIVKSVRPDRAAQDVSHANRVRLARKLLLGRHAGLLRGLRDFWTAESNGISTGVMKAAIEAIDGAFKRWPGKVYDLRPAGEAARLPFTSAYANFVASLATIEQVKDSGPLGAAVSASRYAGADGRNLDRPFLPGESKQLIGFPVLLGSDGIQPHDHRATSAWVEPAAEWPRWADDSEESSLAAREGQRWCDLVECIGTTEARGAAKAGRLWCELAKRVAELLKCDPCEAAPLPEWALVYNARCDKFDFESAGLALALQGLATKHDWPLPAGVGFTGGWNGDLLAPVAGIARKIQAAREAGIFALFACTEEEGLDAQVNGQGVDLLLLPKGSKLNEIVRLVNTACAARGLTEDRWRWVSEHQQDRLEPARREIGVSSRLLPRASEACRFGFVGRTTELGALDIQKRQQASRSRLIIVEGEARDGKTTLLSHWLNQREVWPQFPLWYSFLRDHDLASGCEHLRHDFERQLQARHRVVLSDPVSDPAHGRPESVLWSPLALAVAQGTDAPIDFAVDGLDEARSSEQDGIRSLLATLPGRGVRLVGAQTGTHCLTHVPLAERVKLVTAPDMVGPAARELIGNAATQLGKSQNPEVAELGRKLESPEAHKALLAYSSNLWILTEFLGAIADGTQDPPASLADLPPIPTVVEYCERLVEQVLNAFGVDRADGEEFLRTLAIVDVGQPWPIAEVTRLSTETLSPAKIRQLCSGHAKRLLANIDGKGVFLRNRIFREEFARRSRDAGPQVVNRLVTLMAGNTELSGFLGEYVADHAARLVIEYAEAGPELAARLLLDTAWPLQRLQRLLGRNHLLGILQFELSVLGDRMRHSRRGHQGNWVRSLRDTLAAWRHAMELPKDAGGVPPVAWWKHLKPVLGKQVSPVLQNIAPQEMTYPVLLSPPDGYGPASSQALELNGTACAFAHADEAGLAFGTSDGRLHVFRFDGTRHIPVRVIPFGHGEVRQLETVSEGLILALAVAQSEQKSELWLIDVTAGIAPCCLHHHRAAKCFTVAEVQDDTCRVVLAYGDNSGTTQQLFQLQWRVIRSRGQGSPGDFTPDGSPWTSSRQIQPHGLHRFAQCTWVMLGFDNYFPSLDILGFDANQITYRTSYELAEAVHDRQINGICHVPKECPAVSEDCLAVVVSERLGQAEDCARLLVVLRDGTLLYQIRLDSALPLLDEFASLRPVGWHANYGLILHGGSYLAIGLTPGALACPLPKAILQKLERDPQFGELEGTYPLPGGQVLLTFSTWAAVLGPNSQDITYVQGLPSERRLQLVDCRKDGCIVACESTDPREPCENWQIICPDGKPTPATPAPARFLAIHAGVVTYALGSELWASPGTAADYRVWDASEVLTRISVSAEVRLNIASEQVELLDAWVMNKHHWVAAVAVHRTIVLPDSPALGIEQTCLIGVWPVGNTLATVQIHESSTEVEVWKHPVRNSSERAAAFRAFLAKRRVMNGLKARIEGIANDLVGFQYGTGWETQDGWDQLPLKLYAMAAATPHGTARMTMHGSDSDSEICARPLSEAPSQFRYGSRVAEIGVQYAAVAYDSGRFEIVRVNDQTKRVVAVGFVAEEPQQVMATCYKGRWHLAVTTPSGVTWFDLGIDVGGAPSLQQENQ